MAKMSDLSEDLLMEILYRVPMTSLKTVRSTCKKWNTLSKYNIFGKSVAKKQVLGFMIMDFKICSLRFNLQGIRNNDGDFIDSSIKQISHLETVRVYHCDGLLLCVTMDQPSSLVVWNPYLGQTRWILPRNNLHRYTRYALGYGVDNKNKNHQHKILRFSNECMNPGSYVSASEIYDFSSDAWRVLDVSPEGDVQFHTNDVSLKGNTYFFAQEKDSPDGGEIQVFLLCFDFTRERFGSRLAVPFRICDEENVILSCVGEDQVAVLHQSLDLIKTMEIWVTTKIEPNAVSWSKFLKVDRTALIGLSFEVDVGSFFIDEEKKIAVVFDIGRLKQTGTSRYQVAYIVGEDGYFKSVSLHLGLHEKLYNGYAYCHPFVCSSYVPSLVQVEINQLGKRKDRDY
ncbi:unnamed protein product [Microthlaspi erraticum]|uniref:F-box domain-containing protein n=1 Tax=Microthlaspi erraticum TaxID=1685480 RepID=A0A6D2JZ31_9BRAS|nr:unnamed protein product [Microthlaspi erraticum]